MTPGWPFTAPFPSAIANSRAVTSSSGLPLHFPSQLHRTGGCLEAAPLSAQLPSFLQRKVPFGNTGRTRQLSVSRPWEENTFLTFHMASKNTRINSPWTVNFSFRRHKWRCEDAEHYSVLFACMRAKSWRFEHPLRAVPRLCNIHMIWIQQYVRQAVLLYKKKCLIWPSRGILKILQILKNRCTVWYPISTTMILTELYQ